MGGFLILLGINFSLRSFQREIRTGKKTRRGRPKMGFNGGQPKQFCQHCRAPLGTVIGSEMNRSRNCSVVECDVKGCKLCMRPVIKDNKWLEGQFVHQDCSQPGDEVKRQSWQLFASELDRIFHNLRNDKPVARFIKVLENRQPKFFTRPDGEDRVYGSLSYDKNPKMIAMQVVNANRHNEPILTFHLRRPPSKVAADIIGRIQEIVSRPPAVV